MTWSVKETTGSHIREEGRDAGVICFSVIAAEGTDLEMQLSSLLAKEYQPGEFLLDFFLDFPIDDEDAAEAHRLTFDLLRKTRKVKQAICFNEDEDLDNTKLFVKQSEALVLVQATEEEIEKARKLWDSEEFWGTDKIPKD